MGKREGKAKGFYIVSYETNWKMNARCCWCCCCDGIFKKPFEPAKTEEERTRNRKEKK